MELMGQCIDLVDYNHFLFYHVPLCRVFHSLGLDARKPVFGGVADNTGAGQPAHPRSLINTFDVCFLESSKC